MFISYENRLLLALDLYPFPRLNTHFKRDTLISIAINNKKSIDELDEWLSIADLPLLSRSKTEDLDIFPPNRSTKKSKGKVYSNHRETNYKERSIPMEVLSERCTSTLMCDGIMHIMQKWLLEIMKTRLFIYMLIIHMVTILQWLMPVFTTGLPLNLMKSLM